MSNAKLVLDFAMARIENRRHGAFSEVKRQNELFDEVEKNIT